MNTKFKLIIKISALNTPQKVEMPLKPSKLKLYWHNQYQIEAFRRPFDEKNLEPIHYLYLPPPPMSVSNLKDQLKLEGPKCSKLCKRAQINF